MTKSRVIVYGVMGEGRGHATRSLAIIERLTAQGHRVHVLTCGEALAFFRDQHLTNVHEIAPFAYIYQGMRVHRLRTLWHHVPAILALLTRTGQVYALVKAIVQQVSPVLVITDFEPYTATIARDLGIPLISIDHQHVFTGNQVPQLDASSSVALSVCNTFIRHFFKADHVIAAAFYHFEAKPSVQIFRAHQILRKEVRNPPSATAGRHVTVYLRRSIYWETVRNTLTEIGDEHFHVFSDFDEDQLAEAVRLKNIQLYRIDESSFIASLKQSKAVICTAGNQTIGEAIFLRKPVLAIPEPNAFEQYINARALEATGCGALLALENLDVAAVRTFLTKTPCYRVAIEDYLVSQPCFDATEQVIEAINSVLTSH